MVGLVLLFEEEAGEEVELVPLSGEEAVVPREATGVESLLLP